MDSAPLFTIICVCWNEEAFLEEGIRSVLEQSDPSLEFILVDDHSTDRTFELMTAAATADPRVTAIRNPVKGKVAGFNHAVALARGRWIHLLGGDDLLATTCVEECRRVIEEAGPGLAGVYHDYTILNKQTGREIGNTAYGPWLAEASVEETWRKKYGIGGGFFAIRADLARTVIWPQPTDWKNEDTALAATLKVLGEVRYLARPLYFYRLADQHYHFVPSREAHLKDLIHYSAGLDQLRQRSPDSWHALPPAALEEAGRHMRHAALLSTPGWTMTQAWKSRLGLPRLAMAAVYRCGPRAFATLATVHRKLRNFRLGFRAAR